MTELLVFHALAALITLCSIMVVASRNPVTSAVFLVVDLFCVAGLYAQMDAHFVAAIQVLVYAGAIVVLFMFVIMLLNLEPAQRQGLQVSAPEVGILLVTIVGFGAVALMMVLGEPSASSGTMTSAAIEAAGGNTFTVGMVLFTRYLWPFELASMLILLAIVASVVIAKKDRPEKPEKAPRAEGAAAKRSVAHGAR